MYQYYEPQLPDYVYNMNMEDLRLCKWADDSSTKQLPETGTYLLILQLRYPLQLEVGSLGKIMFKHGYYVYVGSARRGLRHRVSRHLSYDKKIKWHIDNITVKHNMKPILVVTSGMAVECDLAHQLSSVSDFHVSKFGSSDCRCPSHLFYFNNYTKLMRAIKNTMESVEQLG